jgi:hypothetical protein
VVPVSCCIRHRRCSCDCLCTIRPQIGAHAS